MNHQKSCISSLYGSSCVVSDEGIIRDIEHVALDAGREERSFYHLSIDELVRRVKMWRLKMPRVEPHYAVKCNDNVAVIKTLALMGTGFDCASRAEMSKVVSLGVSSSRIIFAHPCKIASHIKYARSLGVSLMTFDSHEELKKVVRLYPDGKLVLRIRCDAESAQCPLGVKFGVHPEEARPLLQLARELNLKVVGVAFHVGSGCDEPAVFRRAIKAAKQVFLEAEEEGHSPTLLDIGGGFLGGKQDTLDEAAGYINTALDEHFPESLGVRVIAEPGRYMVSSAFTLTTPIINKRATRVPLSQVVTSIPALAQDQTDEAARDNPMVDTVMYFVDDGIYGSFNCVLYDHQVVKPATLKNFVEQEKNISSVWGPTCDGLDQIISAMMLPRSLTVGDWLVWEDMGAYTLAAAGTFNGFPLPVVKIYMRQHTRLYLEELLMHQQQSNAETRSLDGSSGIGSDDECSLISVTDTSCPSTPERDVISTPEGDVISTRLILNTKNARNDDDQQRHHQQALVAALLQQSCDEGIFANNNTDDVAAEKDLVRSLLEEPEMEESREI